MLSGAGGPGSAHGDAEAGEFVLNDDGLAQQQYLS